MNASEMPEYDPLQDGVSRVTLLDYLGNDLMVVNAARVSLDVWRQEFDDSDEKGSDKRLLNYMAHHEPVSHHSPFCHPQIQFRITVPLFVARQWTRSNVGTTRNEVSRRYVDADPEMFIPKREEWRLRPETSIKQGSGETVLLEEGAWNDVTSHMEGTKQLYRCLINKDIAPEMVRIIQPQGMYTRWIETGSLYYWYNFVNQRIDSHAQREIRQYAEAIDRIMYDLFPVAWHALRTRDQVIRTRLLRKFVKLMEDEGEFLPPKLVGKVIAKLIE